MNDKEKEAYNFLYHSLNSYTPISDETFEELISISQYIEIDKNDSICKLNEIPESFFFVNKGLLRNYTLDEKGKEYNKIFFDEGTFPGSMAALLQNEPSSFEIQAVEKCQLIKIDFMKYRDLLIKSHDLKLFHIYYLEQNWLIKKELREISIIQEDAQLRYENFLEDYPTLEPRLTQYHIASHLGITPTQLSRIRKKL